MAAVIAAGTPLQVGPLGHQDGADEVERVIGRLRQRVGHFTRDVVAETLAHIDDQALVADLSEVRVEADIGVARIGTDRTRSVDIRGAGPAGVGIDDPDLVVAAVIDEAHVEAEVAAQLTPVADL